MPSSLHRFANCNARKDHRRESWCIHWALFSTSHLMCFHPLSCLQVPCLSSPSTLHWTNPPPPPLQYAHTHISLDPPPLPLPTDLACACETEECMGEPLACKISRYSIFILMLMFYSLLTQTVKLAADIDKKLQEISPIRLYATFGDYINW